LNLHITKGRIQKKVYTEVSTKDSRTTVGSSTHDKLLYILVILRFEEFGRRDDCNGLDFVRRKRHRPRIDIVL
jgi:hypothetical protein